jgi:hypothetical protein
MQPDRSAILAVCCRALATGDSPAAAATLRQEYPFEPVAAVERKYGEIEATRLFCRDGFIDRYAGTRLVFPGTLRLLSLRLPADFPFHPNWKMTDTHEAFWELSPTVDHVIPVARGGADTEANWVTTSMRRNSAKSNWTLEELGWTLHPAGLLSEWDGLVQWFVDEVRRDPSLLLHSHLRRWHKAAISVLHANER